MTNNYELDKLYNYFENNKLAHAYLISTNNVDNCLYDLKVLIKKILCTNNLNKPCDECNSCNLINNNSHPSVKIIEPDGAVIKKEQILNLEYLFSKISQVGDYNIYTINKAELLNKDSTNSMLKFLEEPSDNVIGFFITTDKSKILETIVSRCETITINYDYSTEYSKFNISEDKYNEYIECISQYLNNIENNKSIESILLNKEYFINVYKDRKDIINILKIIFSIYDDALNCNIVPKEYKYKDFEYIYKQNNNVLIQKVDLLTEILKRLSYNVNMELILDKFVIEVKEINDKCIWNII